MKKIPTFQTLNVLNVLNVLIALIALNVGCAVGPQYQRPAVELPEVIRGAATPTGSSVGVGEPVESVADRPWWELFSDPTLQHLIDAALTEGTDVRLAAWRVEESRARAGIAHGERWPAIDGGAGWTRGRSSRFTVPVAETAELYDVRLGLSWEIDLWGRLRRLDETARARYLASEEARRGVLLTLVADVATSYFRLRAYDQQLEIAGHTVESFSQTHTLFEDRLSSGLASGLETASAEAALKITAAGIPDLERRIAAEEHRLALLLGRAPGEVPRGLLLRDQFLPEDLPAGLPADLLQRRPDLRQAEQSLVAANAEVGVAVADFFPRLRLTGAFGGLAPEVSNLFSDGETWSLGGGLLAPVFQGRRLENRHRAAVARWEQAKVAYEAAVYRSLGEASTAITTYGRLADAERHQADAVAAADRAVRIARSRYLSGLADYLEVLQAQQLLFPAEQTLTELRFERLAALVDLYRALGGGWYLSVDEWGHAQPASNRAPTSS